MRCATCGQDDTATPPPKGQTWPGGLNELPQVTYVDLPTSHWPMWSKPQELADIVNAHPSQA